jgi:ABC-type tungstate transport system permease subunit
MGTSDIHDLVDWTFKIPQGGHRPVTLVFAKERNEEAIKNALFERRTVAYFNNILIGRKEFLIPLINASLSVIEGVRYMGDSKVLSITIRNNSDVDFILKNISKYTFHNHSDIITLKAHHSTTINIKTIKKLTSLSINFKVLNGILAPKVNPDIIFNIDIKS